MGEEGTEREELVHRVMIGVDVEAYSRRNSRQQAGIQNALDGLLGDAARAAGLDREKWTVSPGGDGMLAVLPADVDMVKAVRGFTGELAARLAAHNGGCAEDMRFRLRAAVHMGMTVPGLPLGHAGPAPVELSRLLDSDELRRALKASPGDGIAVLVSGAVHGAVAGSGFPGLEPERFRRLTVDNPGKGFRQDAYLYVPGAGPARAEQDGPVRPARQESWARDLGRHWGPRARGVSNQGEHGWRFRGRERALQRITDWLGQDSPDHRVLVVTGAPGAGKSAVLARVVTTADRPFRESMPADDAGVKANIGSVSCAVHASGKTALEIAAEIAAAATARPPGEPEELALAVREALESAVTPGLFSVVIDALDEAASPAQARAVIDSVVLPLAETCPGGRVVVGTRPQDDEGGLLGRFGPALDLVDLDAPEYFRETDLVGYALACLQLRGSEGPYADDTAARPLAVAIARAADRNFLIAGLVARTHGLYDAEAVGLARLGSAKSVRAALEGYLERLAGVGGLSARRLLAALAFAEAPGLTAALWKTAVEVLPPGSVNEPWPVQVHAGQLDAFARSSAANFLVESRDRPGADGSWETSYQLFHQALGEALLAARDEVTNRTADEKALAGAFLREGRATGWKRAPGYLLRSLPAHAARAGLVDDVLTDDDYLLHADLHRVLQIVDHAVSSTARERARLLGHTPEAVAAGAAERTAMFGVTEALDQLGTSYRNSPRPVPYRARWAAAEPAREDLALRDHQGRVGAVCVVSAGDRTLLATGDEDGTVRLWDPGSGQQFRVLEDQQHAVVEAVCAVPAGDRTLLATAGIDGKVRLWDPATGDQLRVLEDNPDAVLAVCVVSAGGRTLLATGGSDGTVRLWDLSTVRPDNDIHGFQGWVGAMCVVPSGGRTLLATGGDDGTVRLRDPASGEQLRVLEDQQGWVRAVCVVPSGGRTLLATAGDDGRVRLRDPASGEQLRVLEGHEDWVGSVCVVPSGGRTLLATGGIDQKVRLWDPATGEQLRVLKGHQGWVGSVCVVPSGGRTLLATSGYDRTVRLWDPATGEQLRVLKGHQGGVQAVCVVPSGGRTLLATSGYDRTVRLWDLSGSGCVLTVPVHHAAHAVTPVAGSLAVGLTTGVLTLEFEETALA